MHLVGDNTHYNLVMILLMLSQNINFYQALFPCCQTLRSILSTFSLTAVVRLICRIDQAAIVQFDHIAVVQTLADFFVRLQHIALSDVQRDILHKRRYNIISVVPIICNDFIISFRGPPKIDSANLAAIENGGIHHINRRNRRKNARLGQGDIFLHGQQHSIRRVLSAAYPMLQELSADVLYFHDRILPLLCRNAPQPGRQILPNGVAACRKRSLRFIRQQNAVKRHGGCVSAQNKAVVISILNLQKLACIANQFQCSPIFDDISMLAQITIPQ